MRFAQEAKVIVEAPSVNGVRYGFNMLKMLGTPSAKTGDSSLPESEKSTAQLSPAALYDAHPPLDVLDPSFTCREGRLPGVVRRHLGLQFGKVLVLRALAPGHQHVG